MTAKQQDLPHRMCGHSDCGQHYIDTGDARCLREIERTEKDQEAELESLKKVLRSVLNIIDGMRPSAHELDEINEQEDEIEEGAINESTLFGGFGMYWTTNINGADMSRPVVIDWPDLDLAARDIRKVLG